jgi:hypothetical protein
MIAVRLMVYYEKKLKQQLKSFRKKIDLLEKILMEFLDLKQLINY